MGLIKKIKKFSIIVIVSGIMSVTLNGCVYANNKNWNDMTAQEKQEVKRHYGKISGYVVIYDGKDKNTTQGNLAELVGSPVAPVWCK